MNYRTFKGFKDPDKDRSILLDARGARRTETLFQESITTRARNSGYEPLYTLGEHEKDGLPSAYQIYMNSIDEADAAIKLVGSMHHWRRLVGLRWFFEGSASLGHEGLVRWREDMMSRDATRCKEQLMYAAEEGKVPAIVALLRDMKEAKAALEETLAKLESGTEVTEEDKATNSRDSVIIDFHNKFVGKT